MLSRAVAKAIVSERRMMVDEAFGLYAKLGTATLWRTYTRQQVAYEYAYEQYERMRGASKA